MSPQAKVAGNYVSPMVAKWKARRAGYDEIVLLSDDGSIAEAPTCNLFLVDAAGTLRTPPIDRVLHGITRASVLDLAADEGLRCEVGTLRPDDLFEAAEVFLTATTAGVWPAASVDDKQVGSGKPGPVTERLRERLTRAETGEDPAFEHWLAHVEA